jgi:hypothetical protein
MAAMKSEPFELVVSKLNALAGGYIDKLHGESKNIQSWMRAEFRKIHTDHVPYVSILVLQTNIYHELLHTDTF